MTSTYGTVITGKTDLPAEGTRNHVIVAYDIYRGFARQTLWLSHGQKYWKHADPEGVSGWDFIREDELMFPEDTAPAEADYTAVLISLSEGGTIPADAEELRKLPEGSLVQEERYTLLKVGYDEWWEIDNFVGLSSFYSTDAAGIMRNNGRIIWVAADQ